MLHNGDVTSVLLYMPVAQLLPEHCVLWTLQLFFPCKPEKSFQMPCSMRQPSAMNPNHSKVALRYAVCM